METCKRGITQLCGSEDPEAYLIWRQLMQSSETLFTAVMRKRSRKNEKVADVIINEETGQIVGLERIY